MLANDVDERVAFFAGRTFERDHILKRLNEDKSEWHDRDGVACYEGECHCRVIEIIEETL